MLTELINPISQMIKTKVYNEIIKTFLNKNIINFSIESNSENNGSNTLPDSSEEILSNFVTSFDEIILTNDNYIFTAKENNQTQEENTIINHY